MARKNVVKSYGMIDAGDLSLASITSNETNVINQDKASVQLYWSGGPAVGTLVVQARNGENQPWYALDMGGTISISGASGSHQLVFNELPFTDIRLVYTRTSGSGELNAFISMKQVGG